MGACGSTPDNGRRYRDDPPAISVEWASALNTRQPRHRRTQAAGTSGAAVERSTNACRSMADCSTDPPRTPRLRRAAR